MSLQKRLNYLLVAFAAFALAATFGTIYGVRLHVEDAISSLQESMDDAAWIDRVRLDARKQAALLREVVEGRREIDELYLARRDGFLDELRQVTQFALRDEPEPDRQELLELSKRLRQEFESCLAHTLAGRHDEAQLALGTAVETRLLPALELRLRSARSHLDDARNRSVDNLVATNTQVLVLSALIGVLGVGLVTVGATLIRRWMMVPIRQLQNATREFGEGRLDARVSLRTNDELGALGQAMNQMAEGLSRAQAELTVSEAKYRSLFRNLRDAAIICDSQGRVIECHDSDANILGALARDCTGRSLLDLWSEDGAKPVDWPALIGRALTRNEQVRVTDLPLACAGARDPEAIVDLIAYPIEFAEERYVAIVLRDVTERRHLERQTRLTEAMEATVTLARGVAHDFNSLLTSAIASLSAVTSKTGNGSTAEHVGRALRACDQAVGLSRALLSFAGGDRGNPEVLRLCETVELILESMEEAFFENIRLRTDLDDTVCARIDPDQFTQIVLNLVQNAREAMPAGGELRLEIRRGRLAPSDTSDGPPTHAVLSVSDTGGGISPETEKRLFEPFFSTKDGGTRRRRGMGLATVYAAVKNANGTVRVDGRPGIGATFRVHLPLAEPTVDP